MRLELTLIFILICHRENGLEEERRDSQMNRMHRLLLGYSSLDLDKDINMDMFLKSISFF